MQEPADGNGTPSASTRTIVVGVDGSASSLAALRWAAQQAQLTGATLQVVNAWELRATVSLAWTPLPVEIDGTERALKALDQIVGDELGDEYRDVAVCTRIVESHPAVGLLEASAGADLLVVGSRGRGAFAGMLLGSVSQHCVAHAPCPVVVVHAAGPAPAQDRST